MAWLRLGLNDATPDEASRRVRVLNVLSTLIGVCVVPYVPIFWLVSPALGLTTAGTGVVQAVIIGLIATGRFAWARAVFIVVQPLVIVLFALMFGASAGVEIMLLPCFVNFLILFAPREWPAAVASVVWVSAVYFAVVVSDHELLPALPRIDLPLAWVPWLRWTFTCVTISMLVTGVSYVTWMSGQTERLRLLAYEALVAQTEARRRADDASEAKSRFLANMSHELRTPLNAIIGYADLIVEELEDEPDHPMRDDVSRIERAGRHLLAIVNDVLDLSKVEAGELALHLEPVSLRALADELRAQLEPLLAQQGDTLTIALSEAPEVLVTDRVRLKQVLLNLLSNAVKFTSGGQVTLRVVVDRSTCVMHVIDTGCGIAPADQARIFHAFVQADDSFTRTHQGTGLGLALSRRFAQALGGALSVRSAPGEGSVFSLTLPLVPEARSAAGGRSAADPA